MTGVAMVENGQHLLQAGRESRADDGGFSADHHVIIAQAAFPLRALAAQNVAAEGALVLDLAGRGHFEPLLHTLVCLLLGHSTPSIFYEVNELR